MAEFEISVDVDAPVGDVFTYLADLTNLPRWDSSVRSAELAADRGPAVGRRFDVVVGFYGKQLDAVYEITAFDCDRSIEWSISGRADGSTTVALDPAGTGTTIRYRTELKMKGLAKVLDRGLKAALEGIGENIAAGLTQELGG